MMMKWALHFRSKLVLMLLLCVVAMLCLVHVSCAQPDSVDVDEELETNFNLDQEGWRGPSRVGGRRYCRRGLCPPGTVCVESPKQCFRAPCPQYDCVPRYSRFGIPL